MSIHIRNTNPKFDNMKRILLLLIIAIISLSAFSQSSRYPFAVGIGANFPDFKGARYSFGEYLTDVYWEHKGPPIMISFGYNLCPSFNLELSGNYAKGDNVRAEEPFDPAFWDININAQYRFANGYLLKEDSWFDPYLLLGPQVSHFDDETRFSFDYGFGINAWFVKNVGIYGQAAYDVTIGDQGYYHFAFGLKYRFNPAPDQDKDGIKDKVDKCPTVWGLEQYEGCPDTDGDGIPDNLDSCKTVKGIAQFNGCPDTDGDGIQDSEDLCPQMSGLKEFQGCPDKDGDGIPDKDDRCPDTKGLAQFKGCPDTDGDGIPDVDDKCPEVSGVVSNNGCPPPPPPGPSFAFDGVIVYYSTAKYEVTSDYRKKLDEASKIMIAHPEAKFTVYGHADAQGDDASNQTLSENRAKKVSDYLVKKGVKADQLVVKGFGETTPAATNDTAEGRAKNRRTEVQVKK
jgi:OmpA-OmpF porin, OOP family